MTNLNNDFDYSKTYYKVLRKDMTHRGFRYEMGLNIDTNEFNDNPNFACVKGGLYFTDFPKIINFIDYGEYLAEITIPKDAKVVTFDGKYRTDKFIINKIKNLHNIDTIKEIIERFNKKKFALEQCITGLVLHGNLDLAHKVRYEYKFIDIDNLKRLFYIIINSERTNKQEIVNFIITSLDWYRYYPKNYVSSDYSYMRRLRDNQRYDVINIIYDNNL